MPEEPIIQEEVEVEAYQESVEKQAEETDPFFATGHFSIHHQPERDENDSFIGE
jgi:hypothetical protein